MSGEIRNNLYELSLKENPSTSFRLLEETASIFKLLEDLPSEISFVLRGFLITLLIDILIEQDWDVDLGLKTVSNFFANSSTEFDFDSILVAMNKGIEILNDIEIDGVLTLKTLKTLVLEFETEWQIEVSSLLKKKIELESFYSEMITTSLVFISLIEMDMSGEILVSDLIMNSEKFISFDSMGNVDVALSYSLLKNIIIDYSINRTEEIQMDSIKIIEPVESNFEVSETLNMILFIYAKLSEYAVTTLGEMGPETLGDLSHTLVE